MDAKTVKSIIILEDEPLIALDHDENVQRAGFTNVFIFSASAAAYVWLQENIPSAALLDIRLRDGSCTEVATLLSSKDIPFVVCSGSSRQDVDPAFHLGIWLSKPCIPEDLISALEKAQAKAGRQS